MFGIEHIDWAIIIVYLVGITVLGTWTARKVKTAASFFISDRRFGKVFMILFGFGTGTHSDHAVSVAAKTYNTGAPGIWYQWLWLFVTPFFWVLAPIFRRMRAVTTADYFEARYDRSVSVLYALVGMLNLIVNIAVALIACSAVITAISGETIETKWAIFGMTVLFVIYGVAGGLGAAIVTDFVQGILTVVLSFLILPFALSAVNGMAGLRESINNPDMFKLVAPGEITTLYVAVIAFNALVGWVTQPHNMAVSAAGKTEMEGRVGITVGMFLKRVCTIAWMLTGLCAVVLCATYAAEEGFKVDKVYGYMARDLLPAILPGLVGLFIASMLAAVMSSCDAFMVTSAGLFTENVYRPLLARHRSDRHYMFVGRIASVVVVACAVFFAFQLEGVISGLEAFWKIAAMMGIAFWVGLFWRRATVAAAWAATLASFAVLLFTSKLAVGEFVIWDFNATIIPTLPENIVLWKGHTLRIVWEGKLWLPIQMILYLSTGFVVMVVVSLFTRPVARDKLDRLYTCLRTPIVPGEPETAPFTLPEGVEPAPRRVLVKHPAFEIPVPTATSVIGFLLSCVGVALMIAIVRWIFSV